MADRMLVAAILLGIAFWCIFLAFQTWINMQRTMLYEMHQTNPKQYCHEKNSHLGLSVLYIVFAITNCTAPTKISYVKEKVMMVLCGVMHWQISLFLSSFLYGLSDEIFYTVNVLVGVAAPLLWAAQATYLTQISSVATIQRNASIFWAILQLSLPVGNGIVFIILRSHDDEITAHENHAVIGILTVITGFGTFVLLFLPKPKPSETNIEDIDVEQEQVSPPPHSTFKEVRKFFFTKEIVLLSVLFLYAGMELAFRTGIYSSNIGFIKKFPNRKQLVAVSGILVGLGEILAGFVFGVLSLKYQGIHRFGCYPIVILGFLVHSTCYLLIFMNMPKDSTFHLVDTKPAFCILGWCEPNWHMALACSFGLGFGDACFNTQIYTLLGKYYHQFGHHGTAFSIFKFLQCLGAGVTFCYSTYLHLKGQLCILFVFALVGTLDFYTVERRMNKKDRTMRIRTASLHRI